MQILVKGGKLDVVMRKKLPPDVLAFFRKQGSRGGKKAAASMSPEQLVARARKAAASAAASMTPEERVRRARKAVAAREAKRKAGK